MAGLRGPWLMDHVPSSWELVTSGALQVCPVACPVWHHYPGGSDDEPFTLTRLPVSPSWNGGTINRLDAAIQRDLDRLAWASDRNLAQLSKDSWIHTALQKSTGKHLLTLISEIRIHWSTGDKLVVSSVGITTIKKKQISRVTPLAHA